MTALRFTALGLLMLVGSGLAVYPPAVKDDGKFFNPASLEAANKKVRAIYEKYHKDVVIETLESLTAEQEKELEKEGKAKFFAKLADTRIKALGVNGVYILVTKKPHRVQVETDPDTRKTAFSNEDRNEVVKRIIARFKEDDFNGGLNAALEYIEKRLARKGPKIER
jgi:uncharacterized membrane protein YgcG